MVTAEKLSADLSYGAVIRNITLDQLRDEENRRELRAHWRQHGVLVCAETDITNELHVELSKVFGDLEGHFQKDRYVDGHPELVAFSSDPEKESTVDVDGQPLVGYIPWHTDFRWSAHPNHGGILRVHKQPAKGGTTGFACMIEAYDRLPEALKRRIDGLEAVCQMGTDDAHMYKYYRRKRLRTLIEGSTLANVRKRPASDFVPVAHPLVRVQPETGRKMLYFTPHMAAGIVGMEPAEAEELLYTLADHITDEDFTYHHAWRKGDMVLWDNLRMLHQADGVPPGEEREVWRTTISAPAPTGRNLAEGGWSWEAQRGDLEAAGVK